MKAVLDVARSQGYREEENSVTILQSACVLPRVKAKVKHHDAMDWREVPTFYAKLADQSGMAAKALMFICLTSYRTSEVLQAVWEEFDFDARLWVSPAGGGQGGSIQAGGGCRNRVRHGQSSLDLVLRCSEGEAVFSRPQFAVQGIKAGPVNPLQTVFAFDGP